MRIPARAWLAAYDRTGLRADVTAGITLAAYLLPSAIGDASLAGLPPQAGLYACLFGGLVFWRRGPAGRTSRLPGPTCR